MKNEDDFIPGRNGGKLRPVKKGEILNPKGMPKGYKTFKTRLREASEKVIEYKDPKGRKKRSAMGEAVILRLYADAISGCPKAAKIILDFAEDKKLIIEEEGKKLTIDPNMSAEEAARIYRERMNGK